MTPELQAAYIAAVQAGAAKGYRAEQDASGAARSPPTARLAPRASALRGSARPRAARRAARALQAAARALAALALSRRRGPQTTRGRRPASCSPGTCG